MRRIECASALMAAGTSLTVGWLNGSSVGYFWKWSPHYNHFHGSNIKSCVIMNRVNMFTHIINNGVVLLYDANLMYISVYQHPGFEFNIRIIIGSQ